MSQATIKCPYCDTKSYCHRILGHVLANHQEEFFNDKKFYYAFRVVSKDPKKLCGINITGSGVATSCCFGCNNTFGREAFATKHLSNKECLARHAKFVSEKIAPIALKAEELNVTSSNNDPALLEKMKLLESQNALLQKQIQTLKNQLQMEKESCEEEMDKRMALQDVVDEELTSQQREIFKRILARKAPEVFKELYDEPNYEVSVSDSDEEEAVEENEEEQAKEEEPPFVPPRNILISAKPSQPRPFEYRGEWLFRDDKNILYDKTPRGDFVRCGILKNEEAIWD